MGVVCGWLLEKPGHLAPDRFAVVTTVDGIPWRLPAPVSPVSKLEPQLGLLSPVRGSLRPHPSKGIGRAGVLLPQRVAGVPACLCHRYHSSCVFSPGLFIFLRGRNVENLPQGWPSFFFSRLHSSLFYMKEAVDTDGRVEEAEGPG